MNTKEKILRSTLKLYNERGIANVSARVICSDLGISPGNFSYHYPSMARLVTDLYSQLVRETTTALGIEPNQTVNLRYFLNMRKQIFKIQHRYKFFYLNLFDILRKFEDIKDLYLMQYKEERIMVKEFVNNFKALGILKYDISNSDYNHLIKVGLVLNNTWLIDSELHHYNSWEEKLAFYMHICCSRLIPFLTESAREEYDIYMLELKAECV